MLLEFDEKIGILRVSKVQNIFDTAQFFLVWFPETEF